MKMYESSSGDSMSVQQTTVERAKEIVRNNFSRNPKDYGWTAHAIQRAQDKGYGKKKYLRRDGRGYIEDREDYGVQRWHFRYLVRNGETEVKGFVDGEVVVLFSAEIESDKGTHTWVLPVVLNEHEENKFKTTAYPKGPGDRKTKRLYTFKPDEFEE